MQFHLFSLYTNLIKKNLLQLIIDQSKIIKGLQYLPDFHIKTLYLIFYIHMRLSTWMYVGSHLLIQCQTTDRDIRNTAKNWLHTHNICHNPKHYRNKTLNIMYVVNIPKKKVHSNHSDISYKSSNSQSKSWHYKHLYVNIIQTLLQVQHWKLEPHHKIGT